MNEDPRVAMKKRKDSVAAIPFWRKVLYSLVPAVFLFGSMESILLLAGHSLSGNKWDENVFLRPHAIATWREGHFFWEQKIETPLNNLGLRGPDVTRDPARPPLLFVGDSITFGEGVKDGEAFPALVGRLFQDRFPEPPLCVVNGGIPGYGIAEETALVESIFSMVQPRLVLLTFCVNDVFDILKQQSSERYARYEQERFSPLFFLSATTRHLFMRYFLFLYVNGLSSSRINGIHPLQQENPDVKKAWDTYFSSVQSLAEFLNENDAELGFIVFPDFSQVVTGIETPERNFLTYGKEQDVPVLILLDIFKKRRNDGVPILIPDGHPNAHAHKIMASAIVDWLAGQAGPSPFPDIFEKKVPSIPLK